MTGRVDLLRDGLLRAAEAPKADEGQLDLPAASADLGACALCGDRAATGRCVQCERAVCDEDRWVMYGLCRQCLTDEELAASRQPRAGRPPDLGIKWVDE